MPAEPPADATPPADSAAPAGGVARPAEPAPPREPAPPADAAGPPAPPGPVVAPVSAAISRLARAHRVLAAQLLRDLELHPGQEALLMALEGVPQRSQSDLVRELGLDHSTVAKSLRRLEISGFVFRRPSGTDGRAVDVALTPRGTALLDRLHEAWARLEDATVRDLSAAQRRAAVPLLEALERAAAEAAAGPTAD